MWMEDDNVPLRSMIDTTLAFEYPFPDSNSSNNNKDKNKH